ncbi:MAG: hypothetical protein U9N81_05800 [Bacillota bacterium]|nr:hypothetical protein [Bacillota bacterium]
MILRLCSETLPDIEMPSVVQDISEEYWAKQQVAVAIDSGIMPLATKTGFAPDVQTTRAQAASADNTQLPWYKQNTQKKVRVKVDMPWGVAAVRGTFWMNEVRGGRQSTSVAHGSVDVSSGGETVTVEKGNSTEQTSPAAPPAPPEPMPTAQKETWKNALTWVEKRATTIEEAAPVVVVPPTIEEQVEQAPEVLPPAGLPQQPPVVPSTEPEPPKDKPLGIADEIIDSVNDIMQPAEAVPHEWFITWKDSSGNPLGMSSLLVEAVAASSQLPYITEINAANGEITLTFSQEATGLAKSDFAVSAKIGEETYSLQNLAYANGKITFTPVP